VIENLFRPTHLLLVLGIALLVFGPKNLPGLGRGLGEAIRGFKASMKESDGEPVSSTPVGTCASCATVNPADSRFCRKCGRALGTSS